METAQQVASTPVATTPVPYDQMKSQCEALIMGKQQKMSALLSFKHQEECGEVAIREDNDNNSSAQMKASVSNNFHILFLFMFFLLPFFCVTICNICRLLLIKKN